MALVDGDSRVCADGFGEHPDDLVSRRIEGMQDAAVGVTALAPEVVLAILLIAVASKIKVGAERDEITHAIGPLADDRFDDITVAKAGAGNEGVVGMGLEAVLGAPHRGYPTLSILARALGQAILRDDGYRAAGCALEGAGEPGYAAADDEDIGLDRHGLVTFAEGRARVKGRVA